MALIAQVVEDFTGAAAGTAVTGADNSATPNTVAQNVYGTGAAPLFHDSSPGGSTKAIRYTTAATTSVVQFTHASRTTMWYEFYLYLESLPATNTAIALFEADLNNKIGDFRVLPDGALQYRDVNLGQWSSAPVSLNQWHRCALRVQPGSATGGLVRIYSGAALHSATPAQESPALSNTNTTATDIVEFSLGSIASSTMAFRVAHLRGDDAAEPPSAVPPSSNTKPTAVASADATDVDAFDMVRLDGSASTDPEDGTNLTYEWTQTAGPTVTLVGSGATRTFTAPAQSTASTLSFTLVVLDSAGAASDPAPVSVNVGPHAHFVVAADGTTRLPVRQRVRRPAEPSPFDATPLYVDAASSAQQAADAEVDADRKDKLQAIADQPIARWVTDATADPQAYVRGHIDAATAAGQMALFTTHAIPLREGGGGTATAAAYRSFIDLVAAGIASDTVAVVVEPDALVTLSALTPTQQTERLDLLRYAVDTLTALTGTTVYIAAGSSSWATGPAGETLTPQVLADRLASVNMTKARGFALNVREWNYTADEVALGDAIVAATPESTHYVIDTSRNGLGPLTTGTEDERTINPDGRALGDRPLTPQGEPLLDAVLWVANVGESDGSRAGAPAAGVFYPDYAIGLVERAAWYSGRDYLSSLVVTGEVPLPTTTWPDQTGIAVSGGRVTHTAGAPDTNATLRSERRWTLAQSQVHAQVAPLPVNGATSPVTTSMLVQAVTAGDEAGFVIDTHAGTVTFVARTGGTDAGATSLPYDTTAHAWLRLRYAPEGLSWDTSPDGRAWVTRRTLATPPAWADGTDLALAFVVNRSNGTPAGSAFYDNVNAAGPPSPGALLGIGPDRHLNHFGLHLPLDTDSDGAIDTHTQDEIASGFTSPPYFETVGSAVQFRAPVDGAKPTGALYARSELREQDADGTDAAWSINGGFRWMSGTTRITSLPPVKPEVIFAQLRNATSANVALRSELIAGQVRLIMRVNGSDTGLPRMSEQYTIGDEFSWRIEASNGEVRVYYGPGTAAPTLLHTVPVGTITDTGEHHFLTGAFVNSNLDNDAAGEHATVELRNLDHGYAVHPTGVTRLVTTNDQSAVFAAQTALPWSDGASVTDHPNTITLDEATRFQTMVGFGAAMTESAAKVISDMPAAARDALMVELFDPDDGIGLSFLRVPIGASPFALGDYTYADVEGPADDPLVNFSVAREDTYLVPRLLQAKSINPALRIMATPWSPPAWMRSGQSVKGTIGGQLPSHRYALYADYLVRYVKAMAARGVTIDYLSVQNEPEIAPTHIGMTMLPASVQMAIVRDHVRPKLDAAGYTGVQVLGYDQDWDSDTGTAGNQYPYPTSIYTYNGAQAAFAGVAWHGDTGSASAMGDFRAAHPTEDQYLTEITGPAGQTFSDGLRWHTRNAAVGAPAQWARTAAWWNLALDENGGPTNGGPTNLRGLVTIDSATSAVTRHPEFYAAAHAAREALPGSVRVARNNTNPDAAVLVACYDRPDGQIVAHVLNDGASAVPLTLRWGTRATNTTLQPGVTTYRWGKYPPPVPVPPGSAKKWWVGYSTSREGLNGSTAGKDAEMILRSEEMAAQAGITPEAMRAATLYHGYNSGAVDWDAAANGRFQFAVNNGFGGIMMNQKPSLSPGGLSTWASGGFDQQFRDYLTSISALGFSMCVVIMDHEPNNNGWTAAQIADWRQGTARFMKITHEHNDPSILYSTCLVPNTGGNPEWNMRPEVNALAGTVSAGQAIMDSTLAGLDPYPEFRNGSIQTLEGRCRNFLDANKSWGFSRFCMPEVGLFHWDAATDQPIAYTDAQQSQRLIDELWDWARAENFESFCYFDVTDVNNTRGDTRILDGPQELLTYSQIIRNIDPRTGQPAPQPTPDYYDGWDPTSTVPPPERAIDPYHDNTGLFRVEDRDRLQVVSGAADWFTTEHGQVVEYMDFLGDVVVAHDDVTFRFCRFQEGIDTAPVGTGGVAPNFIYCDAIFANGAASTSVQNLQTGPGNWYRSNISGYVDVLAVKTGPDNTGHHINALDCFIHDLRLVFDPGQGASGGRSHNDVFQSNQPDAACTLTHCTVFGSATNNVSGANEAWGRDWGPHWTAGDTPSACTFENPSTGGDSVGRINAVCQLKAGTSSEFNLYRCLVLGSMFRITNATTGNVCRVVDNRIAPEHMDGGNAPFGGTLTLKSGNVHYLTGQPAG